MVTQLDKEWKARTLCSDGNCIGVVGADGRCKVCGRAYAGDLPDVVDEAAADDAGGAAEDVDDAVTPADGIDPPPPAAADADDDWTQRTLCIDGNCIGVVGPDGRCKVCGKPHPGGAS